MSIPNGYAWCPSSFGPTELLSIGRLVIHHISWHTVWRLFCCLILQKQHIFFPLSMFLLQPRISLHTVQQLQKRPEDLREMSARVLKARKQSAAQFVKRFSSTIQDFNFEVRSLVLVCNSHVEKELNCKTKPCFLGPMVVVHHTKGGAYILAELNGAISRLRYTAFRIIPYLSRFPDRIPVTSLLDNVQLCLESFPPADEPANDHLFDD